MYIWFNSIGHFRVHLLSTLCALTHTNTCVDENIPLTSKIHPNGLKFSINFDRKCATTSRLVFRLECVENYINFGCSCKRKSNKRTNKKANVSIRSSACHGRFTKIDRMDLFICSKLIRNIRPNPSMMQFQISMPFAISGDLGLNATTRHITSIVFQCFPYNNRYYRLRWQLVSKRNTKLMFVWFGRHSMTHTSWDLGMDMYLCWSSNENRGKILKFCVEAQKFTIWLAENFSFGWRQCQWDGVHIWMQHSSSFNRSYTSVWCM